MQTQTDRQAHLMRGLLYQRRYRPVIHTHARTHTQTNRGAIAYNISCTVCITTRPNRNANYATVPDTCILLTRSYNASEPFMNLPCPQLLCHSNDTHSISRIHTPSSPTNVHSKPPSQSWQPHSCLWHTQKCAHSNPSAAGTDGIVVCV